MEDASSNPQKQTTYIIYLTISTNIIRWLSHVGAVPRTGTPTGARWADLPTPLESALPPYCLSYKQTVRSLPLCFHGLTNCFSHNSFILITICVAPWCFPRGLQDFGFLRHAMGWRANVFNGLQSLWRSWVSFLRSCRLFSEAYGLFSQNPGGVGCHSFSPLVTRHFPTGSRSNA